MRSKSQINGKRKVQTVRIVSFIIHKKPYFPVLVVCNKNVKSNAQNCKPETLHVCYTEDRDNKTVTMERNRPIV